MNKGNLRFLRELSADEWEEMHCRCNAALVELSQRYVPEIDMNNGFPAKPEYLDLIRGAWLLDQNDDKPPYAVVVDGVGYALGLLLQQVHGFTWYLADQNGQFVTMRKKQWLGNEVSVPPFSYVAKRADTQNVEVFLDLFRDLSKLS